MNSFQLMRLDTSLESLIGVGRSESVSDLNKELLSSTCRSVSGLRGRHSYGGDSDISISKPFGLGKKKIVYIICLKFSELFYISQLLWN